MSLSQLHQGGIDPQILAEARRAGTISEDSSIAEAAGRLIESRARALVVTRDGAEVGVITTDDLLRYLVQITGEKETSALKTLPYAPVVTEALRELNAAGL